MSNEISPLVSVVIPNYNYSRFLAEAVTSALDQTYKNLEIIVVDDGSVDDSMEILNQFGDQIIVCSQQNAGVSVARNNGVSASNGQFIAFLDADDVWMPEKIERQVKVLQSDESIALVHVGVMDFDDAGSVIATRIDGLQGEVSSELLRFDRPVILGGGSGVMVRRSAFDEVGGFDTRLSTSADWDLFYQISSRYGVGFVPEVLLKYRVHGSNMHGNIAAMEQDMMLGYEKAFAGGASASRRVCYGNLHRTLAGSYFVSGNYGRFLVQSVRSIWNRPANLGYFLQFPLRRFGRSK